MRVVAAARPRWADDGLQRVTLDVTYEDGTTGTETFGAGTEAGDIALSGGFGPVELPEVLPPAVPVSVTPAQARIALRRAGLYSAVLAAVEAADPEVGDWFEYGLAWERSNPYVAALGAALGMTEEQIDALFVSAAQIGA